MINYDFGDYVYILNLAIAIVLGFAIGLERKMRFKEAGIRTHAIVSVGACLMVLIGKYGFEGADGARVAAQIVSGIGFLGAGMIMYRKEAVHGLTTAAGVWATAGVGMAVGAEMYVLAVAATVIIIAFQCLMHSNCKLFHNKHFYKFLIVFTYTDGENEIVKEIFNVKKFIKITAEHKNGGISYRVVLNTDKDCSDNFINTTLKDNPFISLIERVDDE